MANKNPILAYYIILESGVILDSNPYKDWSEIQRAYPTYISSLGPWTKNELLSYLDEDFHSEANWPITREYIDITYDK